VMKKPRCALGRKFARSLTKEGKDFFTTWNLSEPRSEGFPRWTRKRRLQVIAVAEQERHGPDF